DLNRGLDAAGVRTRQRFLMQSNGGVMPFAAAIAGGKTVHTLLSGPAAGAQAAAYLAFTSPPLRGEGDRAPRGRGGGALRESEPEERPPHPDPLPASGEREQVIEPDPRAPPLQEEREGTGHGLVTLDMGGTSADIAFIEDGVPLEITEGVVARRQVDVPALD